MSEESDSGSPNQEFNKVLQIITALTKKSVSGDYICRGESQCFDKVSSRMYREYPSTSGIEAVQEAELTEAKRYTFETDDFTILTELQHYRGRTNLIDFTADYLIALFFACDGDYPQDGRVILLERTAEREEDIYGPRYPANRVLAQKSIFVRPKAGYVEPDHTVVIPSVLKLPMLAYLGKGMAYTPQPFTTTCTGLSGDNQSTGKPAKSSLRLLAMKETATIKVPSNGTTKLST